MTFVAFACQTAEKKPQIQFGRELYRNGTIKSKGALVNGKKHGLWLFYNEDSSVRAEYLYYQDSLYGRYIGYFEEGGDTLIIGNYVNGLEHGEWKSFYGNNLLAIKAYY